MQTRVRLDHKKLCYGKGRNGGKRACQEAMNWTTTNRTSMKPDNEGLLYACYPKKGGGTI